jgi:hypothetical protein
LVDLLNRSEGNLALGELLLVDARLELFVETLDLVEDLAAGRLARLLGRAYRGKLSTELLLALGRRGVLVVWAGGVELGLDLLL